jgi:hypothetical protein
LFGRGILRRGISVCHGKIICFEKIEPDNYIEDIRRLMNEAENGVFNSRVIPDGAEFDHSWYKFSGKSLGDIGYGWVDSNVEISLALFKEFQGKNQRYGEKILNVLECILRNEKEEIAEVCVKITNPYKEKLIQWFYSYGYKNPVYPEKEEYVKHLADLGNKNSGDIFLFKQL